MEEEVNQWKLKKLIKELESAHGDGTSLISIIIPGKTQLHQMSQKLNEELGTASNIKSRTVRNAVTEAITAAQQRLKMYNKAPVNGLVIYCGNVYQDRKIKKVVYDFEPSKPLISYYRCDNRFHTEPLYELIQTGPTYGFIVVDGSSFLVGTLSGNIRTCLLEQKVDLPKKHGRGGQSAGRFERLRTEKRHNYITYISEKVVSLLITDNRPNISGLIIAGSADLKDDLVQFCDQRLAKIILKTVDVAYSGQDGFNQAINLSADVLLDVKYLKEKVIIKEFYDHIARNTGKFAIGRDECFKMLEMGVVHKLIVWEHHQELELIVDNYQKNGIELHIVSNYTPEGHQFCSSYMGIGAVLRYQMNIEEEEVMPADDVPDIFFD